MALTKNDLEQIQQLIVLNNDTVVDRLIEYMDERFASRGDLSKIKQLVSHLPTRDQFYSRMDQLAGEYDKFTIENQNTQAKLVEIEDRLEITEATLVG